MISVGRDLPPLPDDDALPLATAATDALAVAIGVVGALGLRL